MLLVACSPRFDWREMPNAEGRYVASFPARPRTLSRALPLAGQARRLTLTSAQVGDALFAVGYVDAPGAAPAVRDALRQAMLANLKAKEMRSDRVSVGSVVADEVEARGRLGESDAWMLARYALVGERVYEVLALGPTKALPREAAETFMASFRPTGP